MCANVKTCTDTTRPDPASADSSRGLLVVSFGTTHQQTCRETISAIEAHLAKAIPTRRLYRGWTSRMVIRRLTQRDGTQVDTVEEALDRMTSEGITDVLVVPTHLIPGGENDKMMQILREKRPLFSAMAVSRPLLGRPSDLIDLAGVIRQELLSPCAGTAGSAVEGTGADVAGPAGSAVEGTGADVAGPAEGAVEGTGADVTGTAEGAAEAAPALVLMGHGSAVRPEANRIYEELEEVFREADCPQVFIGTVEGSPDLEAVLAKLIAWRRTGAAASDEEAGSDAAAPRVLLAPLMIVAGDHAINDMAGDEPDSWSSRIAAEGFGPEPILRGLGSYAGVQDMFAAHAVEAEPVEQE